MTGSTARFRNTILWIVAAAIFAMPVFAAPTPYQDLFRLPIPDKLPDHPRVFCTQADLDRIQRDLKAGDLYTVQTVKTVRRRAESILGSKPKMTGKKVTLTDVKNAAQVAQAWALTGDEKFGRLARSYLLWFARVYPTIPTKRHWGRFADTTLREGPFAVQCAMAYDLVAGAPFMTASDRATVEKDLLRTMGWECGHKCGHRNSSNWRTWALTIVASCGFASGDRQLIEEAVNGVWDSKRNAYLYGAVQQISHSFFSDGIHWERSAGYTYYTFSALNNVLVAAENSGINIWDAQIPGILGPFVGSANHEEYGPAGDRSIKYALDAMFYLPFQNGQFAVINDSGRSRLHMVPIYLGGYTHYKDPKYAWLIRQSRNYEDKPVGWSIWTPSGNPTSAIESKDVHSGSGAYRLTTDKKGRIALVQQIAVDPQKDSVVTGWVKPIKMSGASAHIRINVPGKQGAVFSNRVKKAGDWQQVRAEAPKGARNLRLHVFLEGGAGEVLWDSIAVTQGSDINLVTNPGFDITSSDGRGFSFWDLVHAPANVPEGHYSLADDATIGLTGRHENGCTLFPIGGFAVMRSNPVDVDATAFTLTYGPYGSGHDHPDRLHFSLYGLDEIMMPDPGSWGYGNKMHLTWANQTIAHNTLSVDEVAQRPQGMSDSIWAGEGKDLRVFGELRLFHPGKAMKAVRATCDTAYAGVSMDRTLVLVDNYVLDVFRASSRDEHTYDLPYHGLGKIDTGGPLAGEKPASFTSRGYSHLTNVRRAAFPSGTVGVTYADGDKRGVRLLLVSPGADAEVYLASDPVKSGGDKSVAFIRQRGRSATFVSAVEPYRGKPSISAISSRAEGGKVIVEVTHAKGVDRFALDDSVTGSVSIERLDGQGKKVASETAAAEKR